MTLTEHDANQVQSTREMDTEHVRPLGPLMKVNKTSVNMVETGCTTIINQTRGCVTSRPIEETAKQNPTQNLEGHQSRDMDCT